MQQILTPPWPRHAKHAGAAPRKTSSAAPSETSASRRLGARTSGIERTPGLLLPFGGPPEAAAVAAGRRERARPHWRLVSLVSIVNYSHSCGMQCPSGYVLGLMGEPGVKTEDRIPKCAGAGAVRGRCVRKAPRFSSPVARRSTRLVSVRPPSMAGVCCHD